MDGVIVMILLGLRYKCLIDEKAFYRFAIEIDFEAIGLLMRVRIGLESYIG